MANEDQLEALLESVQEWNAWRSENRDIQVDLSRAALADEELEGADLTRALLHRADLMVANLRGADLRAASLVGALLLGADLRGVRLQSADLRGADLRESRLEGADLSSSLFLTQGQLESARGDSSTRLPPTLTRPDHWQED